MNAEKEQVRGDRDVLAKALRDAGAVFVKANAIRCPFHDDGHASGDIHRDEQGVERFKCHAASCGFYGDVFDVQAKASGRKSEDLLREFNAMKGTAKTKRTDPAPRKFDSVEEMVRATGATHAYRYTNPDSLKPDMVVLRIQTDNGKSFMQARPDGNGFILKSPGAPLPLYNRQRVRNAQGVIVVEGEKCVHVLAEIDVVATTSPGGAGKASMADWSPLAGKMVVLWPDNDPPNPPNHPKPGLRTGIEHMRDVVRELEKLDPPPQIYWVDPDTLGLPPKGDVVDFLHLHASGGLQAKSDAIKSIVDSAPMISVAGELEKLFEDTISGKRRAVNFPHKFLSRLSKSLMPSALTTICADPSAGKSFFALDCAAYWQQQKERWDVLFLEDNRAYYLCRAIAQWDGNADLTDDVWVKAHPDEVRQAFDAHKDEIAEFGRHIHCRNGSHFALTDVQEWIKARAASGTRVILVDPITAAIGSDKPWVDDQKFILACESIADQYQCSIVFFTHKNKSKKTGKGHLDDMSGGAAYQRFCHNVIWIAVPEVAKRVFVSRPTAVGDERMHVVANRIVQIRKARSGRGTGMELAFNFDPQNLRFSEMGLVIQEEDGEHDEKF